VQGKHYITTVESSFFLGGGGLWEGDSKGAPFLFGL
jgi:hypothetical protein